MMTLFYTPTACSTASHIALEEAGAAYAAERVKLHRPEAAEAYRAVNPKATVPALKVGEVLLTENVAILAYVAERFPAAKLMPVEPLDKARCLSLLAWFSSSAHITRRQARAPHRFTDEPAAQTAVAAAGRMAFWANLQRIEAILADSAWLMGEQFTVADAYGLVFYGWAAQDEHDLAALPNFTRLKDQMLERAAVRRVLERERSALLG